MNMYLLWYRPWLFFHLQLLPLISYQTVPLQIWRHKESASLYIELQLMNLLQILIPLMYNLIPCDLFQFEGMIRWPENLEKRSEDPKS